jgi:hypothetical protein
MAHDEFPPLTRSGIEVLQRANTANYENHVGPGGIRPFASAVIREAVKQAAPFTCRTTGLQVVAVSDLLAIADNLHNQLPPPLPTLKDLEEIVRLLDAEVGDKISRQWTSNPFEALKAGIAHHCKEQP